MSTHADIVISAAREFLGDRITTNTALRDQHSHGEDFQPHVLPDAVVFAETTEEIARLMTLCNTHGVPVVAFGAGSSLEGHVTPVRGGISLDMTRMNKVLSVNQADLDCRVQAGVTRIELNEYLRDQGLFFPVDPGANATIGGMCATRASGTAAVRYGTMRETVTGLTVVMADGRIITTGGRTRKSSTGYDLTRLFIGSEGTLGIITEIQLRLSGIPEAATAAICQFDSVAAAIETSTAVIQVGIPVARIEFLDAIQMEASIKFSKLEGQNLRFAPTLFFEFHGGPAAVQEQARQAEEIAKDCGGHGFKWTADPEERNRLWRARHDAYFASRALCPGFSTFTTDAIVPISRLTELITGVEQDIAESGLLAPMVGHVGDGNFHTLIMVPPEDGGIERAWALDKKIVARALALGGSCSGEHGVGVGKREFLEQEHGAETLAVMRSIKTTFDPKGILNPGKMFRN